MATRILVTGCKKEVSKNGKDFLKIMAATEDKKQYQLYLWKDIQAFTSLLKETKILQVEADFNEQFISINNFSKSFGSLEDFVDRCFASNEAADTVLDKLLSLITCEEFINLNKKLFVKGSDIRLKFITFPAAKGMHHNLHGGLLQHTLEVVKFVAMVAQNSFFGAGLDKEVLLEGALIHDIGKIEDYIFDGMSIDYSPSLYAGSHLARGLEYIARYADDPSTPRMEHLKHIIMSHHLQQSWGAVAEPISREAIIVFFGDYYSAAMTRYNNTDFDEQGVGKIARSVFIDFDKAYGK